MDSPTSAVQLLVEGTSPKGVLEVLCTSWNLLSIEIRDFRNVENLRTYLWRSVQEEPEARCVHEFLGCLNLGDVDITRRDKARVQAYLASKPRPHGSVSVAAKRGHWDPQHRAFSQLRRFLLNLHAGRSDR